MKAPVLFTLLLLLLIPALPLGAQYSLREHPRLFVTRDILPGLAERSRGGGMLGEDYAMIKADADRVVGYLSAEYDRGSWPEKWFATPWIRFITHDPGVQARTPGEEGWAWARLFTGAESFEPLQAEIDTTGQLGWRGDLNRDGRLSILDAVSMLVRAVRDPAAAELDFSGDGVYSPADVAGLLSYILERRSFTALAGAPEAVSPGLYRAQAGRAP